MVWKIYPAFIFIFFLTTWKLPAQYISGNILSVDKTTLPVAHLKFSSYGNIQKFSDFTIEADSSGYFELPKPEPGLYEIRVFGVMHKSVAFPILIAGQGKMEFTVYLEPEPYKPGRYFHRKEYLRWIRAYGNFNQYSYADGVHFHYQPDGSITADIESDQDTIRYIIRGLTNGPGVLPGADNYILNQDGDYEGVLINDKGAIQLKYDPSVEWPYQASSVNLSGLSPFRYRGYLSFRNMEDTLWVRGPSMARSGFASQVGIISNSTESQMQVNRNYRGSGGFFKQMDKEIKSGLKEMEKQIPEEKELQREAVLLLAYTGMVTNWFQYNEQHRRFTSSGNFDLIEINDSFFQRIIQKVTPVHPMWSMNLQMPVKILEHADFSRNDEVIDYFTNMAKYHANSNLSAVVIQKLLDLELNKNRINPESVRFLYKLILERFGDSNLARKAREKIENSNFDR